MDVAYQGAPGAFGEEACRTFLPGWRPVARASFACVAEAVRAGTTGRGMLPLANSIAGPVPGVAAIIGKAGLAILARHSLPVRMHLLGLPGARIGGIARVASHPMALAQCTRWLARTGLSAEEADNTALAARALALSGDPERAVIASEAAAETYGLVLIARDIHDRADNATTFAVVAPPDGKEAR